MEEGFYHENPFIAASKIFPQNWHYKPWNLAKPQSYYAAILEITNSVKFKHFKLHSDHTKPAYSTCIIHKVIHPKDWGQPLHQPLSFPIHFRTNPQDFNTSYTYWDYQHAWFNDFLLQNQNHSHSWLFYFHSVMNTTNLPLWFLQWWDYYGCHVDYLKEHPLVENGYLHFKNNFQPVLSERKFSSLLIFCTNFFVP